MDEVALLGLLLKDPLERERLSRHPDAFRSRHDLDDSTFAFAQRIDGKQLESQAEGLLRKRLHELWFFVPETVTELGDELWEIFQEYGTRFWPTGHKRHASDALEFLKYLRALDRPVDPREFNRIQFALSDRGVALKAMFSHRPMRIGIHLMWRQGHGYRDRVWIAGRKSGRLARPQNHKDDSL